MIGSCETPTAEAPNCESQQEPEPEPEPTDDPGGPQHGGNVNGGYECHPAYYECPPQVGDLNSRDVGHSVTVFDPNNGPCGLDGNDKGQLRKLSCRETPSVH